MSEAEKTYNVIINDSAKMTMFEHITFLSQVSIKAAEKLYSSFENAFEFLSTFPHRCPVFEAPYATYQYRHMIVERYVILYTIDECKSTVSVEYLWDTRRDNAL